MINRKIMVFVKNSPWGVQKHPTLGNQYKNTINFPTGKKDEFVSKYLCKSSTKNWKDEYNLVDSNHTIAYVSEYQFAFTTTLKKQGKRFTNFTELSMSDIAVTIGKDENDNEKAYFWAIKVASIDKHKITFEAELDVLFTFDIKPNTFSPSGTNYTEQAHVKRYKDDGSIDWDKLLKNDLPFAPTIQKELPLDEQDYSEKVFWILINVVRGANNESRNAWLKNALSINIANQPTIPQTNYRKADNNITTFILPIGIKKPVKIEGADLDTGEMLEKISKDHTGYIANAFALKNLCIGSQTKTHFSSYNVNDEITLNDSSFIHELSWTTDSKWHSDGVSLQNKKAKIWMLTNMEKIGFHKLKMRRIDIDKSKDPILYHPQAFEIKLETWDGESKSYPLHRIIPDSNPSKWDIVRCFKDPSPTNDAGFAWIIQNKKYQETELLNNSYVNMSIGKEIPLTEERLTQFQRDNQNQWETRKTWDKNMFIREMVSGSIGTAASMGGLAATQRVQGASLSYVGSGNPSRAIRKQIIEDGFHPNISPSEMNSGLNNPKLRYTHHSIRGLNVSPTAAGAAFAIFNQATSIAAGIQNYQMKEDMRDAQIKDFKNQVPSFKAGTGIFGNLIIENNLPNATILKLSQYTLPEFLEDQLLSNVNLFGYQVKAEIKLADIINCREKWNYVQATDVFNTLNVKLSPPIKQIISGAFEQGIRIWHYRDSASWKGMLAYQESNNEV